jgi:OFA family oxalate/formate antiporter-like MFS transporter
MLSEDYSMTTMNPSVPLVKNRGRSVTFAGLGINLALGVLYTWSVVSKKIPDEWGWTEAEKALPYAVACLVFAFVMVPAGRMQDRLGPRLVASIGGVLVGAGMILASQIATPLGFIIGFGVLAGSGFGFGYASATPPAVKWFPAARTGMIAGTVVSGFGLASVYIAPLANWLIGLKGVPFTMLALGIGFLVIVTGLAQVLKAPPFGYVPPGSKPVTIAATHKVDYSPLEMIKTWQFHVLEFMFAAGAGAGLMIISKLAKMVDVQASVQLGFVLVAVLAIGNGAGRIAAGSLSDRIGRQKTLLICFLTQTVVVLLLSQAGTGNFLGSKGVLALLSALVGANYGANLALFPSITKDYYGLKNFGVNYGLVFTAWGWGGFGLSLLAGMVYDRTQNFDFAYYCSAGLLVLAAIATFVVKPPHQRLADATDASASIQTS